LREEDDMKRTKLIASDGMWLTDGETYGKIVYLGIDDKPENWYEITESAYQAKMAELEREAQI
jgi:hypothetical protein